MKSSYPLMLKHSLSDNIEELMHDSDKEIVSNFLTLLQASLKLSFLKLLEDILFRFQF